MRKVKVVPHRVQWSRLFQEESDKLTAIFSTEEINIYHIGSTAIPNIYAKPTIDIMMEVDCIESVDTNNKAMKQLGYEAMGEYGIANRRFFMKGEDNRTHHVHIFQKGDEEIHRHLRFRDYLIAHTEEAEEYSQLKKILAERFPIDIERYIEGKNDFIKELDRKASKWSRQDK